MKQLLIVFLLITIGCDKQTPCDCYRINYDSLKFTNCIPDPDIGKTCIGFKVRDTTFNIGCDLIKGKELVDGEWFEIKCNYK